MTSEIVERAALLMLLRRRPHPGQRYADLVEERGSALTVLDEEAGFFGREGLRGVVAEIDTWRRNGYELITILDASYPENLRAVHDRPAMIFVAGTLTAADARSVAVIGSRRASREGMAAAEGIARHLVEQRFTVVSGLASGIDARAHGAALDAGGRTVAVIGTGLAHCYPPSNRGLQKRIAAECAVVSQFVPDTRPSNRTFPMRNAVMSGLALATVIVEASETSGTRIQARLALAQGRPVLLLKSVVKRPWAAALASHPGVYVVSSPGQVTEVVERLSSTAGALTA